MKMKMNTWGCWNIDAGNFNQPACYQWIITNEETPRKTYSLHLTSHSSPWQTHSLPATLASRYSMKWTSIPVSGVLTPLRIREQCGLSSGCHWKSGTSLQSPKIIVLIRALLFERGGGAVSELAKLEDGYFSCLLNRRRSKSRSSSSRRKK